MAKKQAATAGSDLPQMTFDDVKKRTDDIVTAQSVVKTDYRDIADRYFLDKTPAVNSAAYDASDIRLTNSPTARNVVTGLHRMMRTSKPRFEVKCDNEDWADRMENAAEEWWNASCARAKASHQSDLALSAIMFSDANLEVDAVQDLIGTPGISAIRKTRLTDLQIETPFLFRVGSAFTTYPVWGEDGLSEYLRRYQLRGRALKERWGNTWPVQDNLDYWIRDYRNTEIRCVYYEGATDPLMPPTPYDLPDMPCFSAVADGTDLFDEEKRKRQPFLYGWIKSNLADRESELLTALFTSVYSRGVGPIALLDPASVPAGGVVVNYQGLFRYVVAKGQFADDKAFDANLIQLGNMLSNLAQQSTINSQTLGENISAGTPYSGYAMAAQNGRIPIIPIQEACEKVIHDAFVFAFKYYKSANMKWIGKDGQPLNATEIPDVFRLKVTLEVDLPQDQFKMAQIATQLAPLGIASKEWIRELLQIHDSSQMEFDVLTERAASAAFQQDLPNLVAQMLQMAGGTAPSTTPGSTTTPGSGGVGVPPGYHQMPDGSIMADSAMPPGSTAPSIPGGPAAAQVGGGALPATQPIPPDQAGAGVAR